MCHADYATYTLFWGPNGKLWHRLPGAQKCVNWDKLHGWMQSRAANTLEFEPPSEQ